MNGSQVSGLLTGRETLLVGIEEQDDGGLRLYLGHRSSGLYAVVYDRDVQDDARRLWGLGCPVTVPMPGPDQIFREETP